MSNTAHLTNLTANANNVLERLRSHLRDQKCRGTIGEASMQYDPGCDHCITFVDEYRRTMTLIEDMRHTIREGCRSDCD